MRKILHRLWIFLSVFALVLALALHESEQITFLLVLVMLVLSFPAGLLVYVALFAVSWLEGVILGAGMHIHPIAYILLVWVAFFAVGYFQWFGRFKASSANAL